MLAIILGILKIIGIIALCIIGLILLLILLVLFVPIRYKIESTNEVDGKIEARARISWLLHLIHVKVNYKEDVVYSIHLFAIRIYPRKNKKEEKKENKVQKKELQKREKNGPESKDTQNTAPKEDISMNKDKRNKEKNKFTFRGLYDKIKKRFSDIKENFNQIKRNIDRITDERTKRAIFLCKDQLIRLLKAIFPKKINGTISLGLENPATLGEIYGAYCSLFVIHKGNIVMIPCFTEKRFDYRIKAVGRIYLITMLIIGVKVYFNKDVQRLIKIFQKEEE